MYIYIYIIIMIIIMTIGIYTYILTIAQIFMPSTQQTPNTPSLTAAADNVSAGTSPSGVPPSVAISQHPDRCRPTGDLNGARANCIEIGRFYLR